MQFMNSILNKLVKDLSGNDLKHLTQEFSGDLLELVKKNGVNPYEYVNSFKKFPEDKLPDRSKFFISVKSKCISGKNTCMLSMFGIYNG